MPLIGLEAGGYFNVPQLPSEALDFFIAFGYEVVLSQDSLLGLSKLLGVLERAAMTEMRL